MSDESRPNYRLIYDGQIEGPFPVFGNHDFYAPDHREARGTAITTIIDWNKEHVSFGLAKLLALNASGQPIGDCLLRN